MNDLSKKLLAFSRDQILTCLPSLSLALSDLSCLDADVSSLCFDGLRLYGSDRLICRLFLDQALTRTLLHITVHRLFLHFLPQKTDRSLWDLSSDIASEAFLDRLGLFPDGKETERNAVYQNLSGCLMAFSAEAIYQLFKEQPPSFSPLLFARDDHRLWYPFASSREPSPGSGPSGGLNEEERLEALKKSNASWSLSRRNFAIPSRTQDTAPPPACKRNKSFLKNEAAMIFAVISGVFPFPGRSCTRILTVLTIFPIITG